MYHRKTRLFLYFSPLFKSKPKLLFYSPFPCTAQLPVSASELIAKVSGQVDGHFLCSKHWMIAVGIACYSKWLETAL